MAGELWAPHLVSSNLFRERGFISSLVLQPSPAPAPGPLCPQSAPCEPHIWGVGEAPASGAYDLEFSSFPAQPSCFLHPALHFSEKPARPQGCWERGLTVSNHFSFVTVSSTPKSSEARREFQPQNLQLLSRDYSPCPCLSSHSYLGS